MAEANLAHTICELITSAGLSQRAAAARLGIDQPKVSALMRGKLRD
jgi:predicted XRE-type DNA-binding protein